MAAIWVGFVAGWWANWRRERRFVLWQVLLLGFAIEIGSFLFLVFSNDFNEFFIERLLTNVVISGVAIATVVLIVRTLQQDESRRRIEADQLDLAQTRLKLTETQLALTQAELRALHAQINPHFLFNSLNTINYFIRTDPENARNLLGRLSEIFQRVLNAGDQVPLREEIGLVEAYLVLEKARLEDRLNIVWTNLARETENASVPTLILQPIVENAVMHGIAPQEEGGTVHILLDRVEGELLVQVTDDGAGFDATSVLSADSDSAQEGTADSDSIGLRNVDRRLRMLFGDDHGLRIESQEGQGTRVVFRIPVEYKSQ